MYESTKRGTTGRFIGRQGTIELRMAGWINSSFANRTARRLSHRAMWHLSTNLPLTCPRSLGYILREQTTQNVRRQAARKGSRPRVHLGLFHGRLVTGIRYPARNAISPKTATHTSGMRKVHRTASGSDRLQRTQEEVNMPPISTTRSGIIMTSPPTV